MVCTPVNIQPGLFINVTAWSNAPSTTFDGKSLTLDTGPINPGLSVQQGTKHIFHQQLPNRSIRYMVLGGKYLVILDVEGGGGTSTRDLSLVNFDTWTEVSILTVLADSNAVALPVVNPSQGNGNAFLAYGQNGTEHTSVAIYRSNNGDVLCSLGFPIVPTGQTAAEATATELIIHYVTGSSHTGNCPLPKGIFNVTPSSNNFPDVSIGGCPVTPPTKQFIIKNTGNDCLTITSIANNSAFAVQSTSKPLPVSLSQNETLDVTVAFNPTTVGTWNSTNLVVSTSDGNKNLVCNGKGIAAVFKIGFNSTTFNFGSIPVGTTAPNRTLTITNTGSKPLTIIVPALSASGFTCAGSTPMLACGASVSIPLGFTPPSEGPQTAVLSIASQAPGSPHTISLTGEGCIANSVIAVPPTTPIDLGQIQQGFRTVRFIEISNLGDGPLTFNGALSGPDASLFGLPDPVGSITNVSQTRSYTVDAIDPCGNLPSGSGKTVVAISFFANVAPNSLPKTATLTISGHNATNFPSGSTWSFPISATVIAPVALDIGLVIDRSGSMTAPLGSRIKMDAAISASQLFVELLRADIDDRASIVRFHHQPEVIVPMSSVSTASAPTQSQMRDKIATDVPPPDGFTAIAGGTLTGITEVQKPRAVVPSALTQAVVVLTDGIENRAFESPGGSGNWVSIKGGPMTLPEPQTGTVTTNPMQKPTGIKIYAIGLGRDSDIDATQLSALATSAQDLFRVDQELKDKNYFLLEKYYTQIFMDVAGTSSIQDPMYWISPGETQEIEFDVLRGDVDALIVIFDYEGKRLPFYCLSPKGEIVDPVMIPPNFQLRSGWTDQTRFVEFKMPLNEPDRYAGRWKVIIEHQGRICFGQPIPQERKDKPGFLPLRCEKYGDPILYGIAIGVGSNFRMMPFVTPNPVYVGDPILLTALITEAGLPVTGCNVTVTATSPSNATWTQTLFDDGTHSDGSADDGEYADNFTHSYEAGTYHFLFHATGYSRDGEPVVREAVRDKVVLSRTPTGDPNGGTTTNSDECCKDLAEAIKEQTKLLRSILKQRTPK